MVVFGKQHKNNIFAFRLQKRSNVFCGYVISLHGNQISQLILKFLLRFGIVLGAPELQLNRKLNNTSMLVKHKKNTHLYNEKPLIMDPKL